MSKLVMAALIIGATLAGTASAETQPAKTTQAEKPVPKQATPAPEKRLPGRDCKWYEGGTRQHVFPQYEVGNPNRPECPPQTK